MGVVIGTSAAASVGGASAGGASATLDLRLRFTTACNGDRDLGLPLGDCDSFGPVGDWDAGAPLERPLLLFSPLLLICKTSHFN